MKVFLTRMTGRLRRRPGRVILGLALLALIALALYVPGKLLWAEAQFRSGQRALQRRDFPLAKERLTKYLNVWPNSVPGHLLLAQAARRAGYYDEALRQLEICENLEGSSDAGDLERLLFDVQQGDLRREGDLQTILERNSPEASLICEALVLGYRQNYSLERMRRCLDSWLAREPDNTFALLQRAWLAQRQDDLSGAIADLRRAVDREPDNSAARLLLAQSLLRDGRDIREAETHFQRLEKVRPNNPDVGLGLALCCRKRGSNTRAEELLDELAARFPRAPAILLERGRLDLERGQITRAEKWLRGAAALAPHDYQVIFALTSCMNKVGSEKDKRYYQRRLKRLDDNMKRLADLTDRLQRRPQDPQLRCAIGRVFLSRGEKREALHWFQSALRFNPGHSPTHRALAEYYAQENQTSLAEDHRNQAGPPKDTKWE